MLIAADGNRRDAWALHAHVISTGAVPVVPAGVLAQPWRGGRQPLLSRFLQGCRVESVDEIRARKTGVACGRASTSDVVDAMVVVSALERIATALGPRLALHRI